MAPRAGRLLVATPAIDDPNFDRSVVLVLEHDAEGTLGVVLDRPSELEATAVLPTWGGLSTPPGVVFRGGPVQPDAVVALGRAGPDGVGPGLRPVLGPVGILDLSLDPVGLLEGLAGVRLFAGYAGWGPGQLESEVRLGAWWQLDAEPGDAFTADPPGLWRTVLARQRGELAWYAGYPEDPDLN